MGGGPEGGRLFLAAYQQHLVPALMMDGRNRDEFEELSAHLGRLRDPPHTSSFLSAKSLMSSNHANEVFVDLFGNVTLPAQSSSLLPLPLLLSHAPSLLLSLALSHVTLPAQSLTAALTHFVAQELH
jgi:hypothetical protein